MTPQQPAEGILRQGEFGDSKLYRIICNCGDSHHDHDVWVEADDIGVTVTIYSKVKSPWWKWNRFRQIWVLLTRGYLEHETSIIMKEQTALNYAETLKSAIKDVQEFRRNK